MSTDIKNTTESNIEQKYFILLLTYSLLPGIYKVLNNQAIMLFSVPIILYLFYKSIKNYRAKKIDIPFIVFFCYAIIQSFLWLCSPWVNKIGILMGIYLNILPMLGFFISRGDLDFKVFTKIILKIVIIHCILGIILYPIFSIVDHSNPIVKKITEGVAYGRMSSVAGSLIFGNLMLVGFIVSFFSDKRFLPLIVFCLIFNAQRSAWGASLFSVLIYLYFLLKNLEIKNFTSYVFSISLFSVAAIFFISNYVNFDIDFMLSRIDSIGEASSERNSQWLKSIENFFSYPLGVGVGQVGQIASRYNEAKSMYDVIPDGDYFRILYEHGFIGALFFIFVIISAFLSLFLIRKRDKILILVLVIGYLIQMIGSNISEFYFTNFIYWTIFGYYFLFLNQNYKFKI
ncbi:O-antigen ligase family protein [Capnocytophaga cynodegmi]|uniref:O-antigen ligase-related domain-containing protein n=1 Tax=Capnocytophaga cynodegmi TaxID=28189 RepID=A0A0B7H5Z5_9FLAO|nr:O-antigen ligase family protein [Capnocytophaga cynodegmi]GIM55025.1 hypothetical protein CAPN005_16720 [Capnocytophaga cynodegmi]CEN34785.1 conserved membrane hypothetical protein [Capnocytophaga cynodegmi]